MSSSTAKLIGGRVTLLAPVKHQDRRNDDVWFSTCAGFSLEDEDIRHMHVRIDKTRDRPKDDCSSPVVDFSFQPRKGLVLNLGEIQRLKGHPRHRRCGNLALNPYLNKIQDGTPPRFIIPLTRLKRDTYRIETHSSLRGDFVVLESTTSRASTHYIVINLWALSLLQGIREITLDGKCYFANQVIGQFSPDNALPFYQEDTVPFGEQHSKVGSFMYRSHMAAWGLVNRGAAPPPAPYLPAVTGFLTIDWTVYNDRSSTSEETGAQQARELFTKLFRP